MAVYGVTSCGSVKRARGPAGHWVTGLLLRHAGGILQLTLASCTAPAFAAGCDELRQSIEARIRANGVPAFSVTVVDAAASAPGQVVGTCEQGRRKLLYVRGAAPSAMAASKVPPPPGVITECADGRVITEGTCKK